VDHFETEWAAAYFTEAANAMPTGETLLLRCREMEKPQR
jgi:hypothetical protein